MSSQDETPKAVQDCHELLLWIIPHLDKLPRLRRFTIGERLESLLLETLEQLVEVAYSREKRAGLAVANRRLETARHLWRLAHELRDIPTERYEHGAKRMVELGRQVGGWRKAAERAA